MVASTACATRALATEQRRGARLALLCWAAVLVLFVIGSLARHGVLEPTRGPLNEQVWPTSVVALAGLFLLSELIALTLATEHLILRSEIPPPSEARLLVALRVAMAVVAVALAAAATVWWVSDWEVSLRDAHAWTTGIAVVGGLLVLLGVALDLDPLRPLDEPDPVAKPPQQPTEPPKPVDTRRICAIAASGGGIRAASFVLGGHQAVQAKADDLDMADQADEPNLFAVSGGSYMAAALAMRRAFDPDTGSPRRAPVSWREAYTPGSPELDRLRRHTRYLFEPKARTRDGLLSLVAGAVINLLLAASVLLGIAWVSIQLVSMLGLTRIYPAYWKGGDAVTDFRIDANLENWELWGLVPLVAATAAAVLTLIGWLGAARYDKDARSNTRSIWGRRMVGWSGSGRPIALGVGLGWLVLVLGLPAAATGAAEAATQNQPTATVAHAMTSLGLATPKMCSSAFRNDVEEKLASLKSAAATGVERTATAGACGLEIEVSSTEQFDSEERYAAAEEFAGIGRGARLAGLGALLLAVLGFLRTASTSSAPAEGTRFARIRGRLMVWVPLLVTFGIALYLVLLCSQRMLLSGTATASIVTWAALGAGLVSFFLNANVTTLHNFYRSRLSDAFAVSVTDGTAKPLKEEYVYRFSDMPVVSVADVGRLDVSLGDLGRVATKLDLANENPDAKKGIAEALGQVQTLAHDAAKACQSADLTTAKDSLEELARTAKDAQEEGKVTDELRDQYRSTAQDVVASLERTEPTRIEQAKRAPVRLHVVATLNTQASNESATMRGGFPMVIGPDTVSVFRARDHVIAPPTRRYEDFAGPGRVSIMAAVAVSGAAVSPLMGRQAGRSAPFRFLLALFNVRLGTWVLNPAHTPEPGSSIGLSHDRLGRLPVLWMTSRPGAGQMLKEAAGSSSADGRWVYVSDGGHLDNTGLVEAVRHTRDQGAGGRVLCLDASNDAPKSWNAVGDAISVIRADLDLSLVRVHDKTLPPWARLYRVDPDNKPGPAADDPSLKLEVLVVKAVRVDEPPADKPADPDWWRALPSDVQAFQTVHSDFPRASTARQKFGDLEFEAYRQLGYVCATIALEQAGWLDPPATTPVTPPPAHDPAH